MTHIPPPNQGHQPHPGQPNPQYPQGQSAGYPPAAQPPQYGAPRQSQLPEPTNKTAVFILGLLAILPVGAGIILGPLAVILSSTGRQEIREGRARKDGLFTAGYVMGMVVCVLMGIGILIGAIVLVCVLVFGSFVVNEVVNSAPSSLETPDPWGQTRTINPQYENAKKDIRTIKNSVSAFKEKQGYMPTRLEDVAAFSASELPDKDPWGNPYTYKITDRDFEVHSKGADAADKEDDVFYKDGIIYGGSK